MRRAKASTGVAGATISSGRPHRGDGLLDILEGELELADLGPGLGGLPERLAPRLRQLETQSLQLEVEHDAVRVCLGDGGLGGKPRGALDVPGDTLCEDHRVRGGEVFWKRLRGYAHP